MRKRGLVLGLIVTGIAVSLLMVAGGPAAAQLTALSEPDRAADEARAVIARKPSSPYGAFAQA